MERLLRWLANQTSLEIMENSRRGNRRKLLDTSTFHARHLAQSAN
jgi:hypothetical protein